MKSGRPRGPGRAFKNVGGFAPHIFERFPGLPGPDTLKNAPKLNLARLPSGTQDDDNEDDDDGDGDDDDDMDEDGDEDDDVDDDRKGDKVTCARSKMSQVHFRTWPRARTTKRNEDDANSKGRY